MAARNCILNIAIMSMLVAHAYMAQACGGLSDGEDSDTSGEVLRALARCISAENDASEVMIKKSVEPMDEHEQKVFELLKLIVTNQNDCSIGEIIIEYCKENRQSMASLSYSARAGCVPLGVNEYAAMYAPVIWQEGSMG